MEKHYIIKSYYQELIINKSRFIAILMPLGKHTIKKLLTNIKKEYPKATHYCYAYISTAGSGSNDDSEPAGTAGIPILNILNYYGLNDCLCVVVRYYGGIKLGASGLLRAYENATKNVCKELEYYKYKTYIKYKIMFTYSRQTDIEKLLIKAKIAGKVFADNITYFILADNIDLIENLSYLLISSRRLGIEKVLEKQLY